MKHLMTVLILALLTACSMSGFQPPRETGHWTLPGVSDKTYEDKKERGEAFVAYMKLKHKEMRECGIDPFTEGMFNTSEQMCMEEKGWVYK